MITCRDAKKARNDFEKAVYKLMSNSVFDKTMENIRERMDKTVYIPDEHKQRTLPSNRAMPVITSITTMYLPSQ